jgi:hypothetical protein
MVAALLPDPLWDLVEPGQAPGIGLHYGVNQE